MKLVSVTELKKKVSTIIRLSQKEDVIVISKGKPVAIIKKISEDEIAEVEDYVLSHHPKFKSMIEDAYSEFLEGKTIPLDKVISKIGSKNAKIEVQS